MRLKRILIVGMVTITAILVAGCGGGGSTSGNATAEATTTAGRKATDANAEAAGDAKPLSKSAFRTRVNEICIQVPPTYEEELKKLEKGGQTPSKSESNLKAAIPPLLSAIEQMKAVKPPANEAQKLEKVVAALESAAKGLEAKPNSKLSGPGSPFAKFQKVTKESGFETCSGL